ncbi:hypothetical protein HVA01_30300 [Halovibrio variabilis]|uniref:4'-phosphopantetheinyl transferase N-terminal domain-containing protein n=1 Tax=Halovibrio variabilis TaxID=31910 RepID=A0A511US04_9GAMM|nr:hypothetical protein [Halovibrio variabilis]GEN29384.1 hypothetical protein HVA01_30300 [Halovibrio variabilis]
MSSAARSALAQLGFPSIAIPMGDDRAPVWPANTIGSISHISNVCIAVVTSAFRYRAIGVDMEYMLPLENSHCISIATTDELYHVNGTPDLKILKIIFNERSSF